MPSYCDLYSSDYCTERYVYFVLYVAIATYYLVFMCWKCKLYSIFGNDKNTVLNLTPVLLFGFELCTHHNDPLQIKNLWVVSWDNCGLVFVFFVVIGFFLLLLFVLFSYWPVSFVFILFGLFSNVLLCYPSNSQWKIDVMKMIIFASPFPAFLRFFSIY